MNLHHTVPRHTVLGRIVLGPFVMGRRRPAIVRLLVALCAAVVGALAPAVTATAGGWAVTTLDATPTPVPGEPIDVGFVIRQHGVTPVEVEGAAIEVIAADGTVTRFPALLDGKAHYVATITLPDVGTYTWRVNQGWFAPQDLGQLIVAPAKVPLAAPPAVTALPTEAMAETVQVVETTHEYPAVARYGLPALAIVFGAMAVADAVMRRRQRRTTSVVA